MKKSMIAGCIGLAMLLAFAPKLTGFAATAYPADWEASAEDNAPCCYMSSDAHSGNYAFAHGLDKGYIAATYQEVTGLPAGNYTLTGYVKSSGGQKNCWLSIKDYGAGERRANITFSDEWTQIKLENIQVYSGKAVLSLWTETDKAAWALIDDIELTGPDGKNYVKNGGFETINKASASIDAEVNGKPDTVPPTGAVTKYFDKWTIYAEPTADVAYTVKGGHSGQYSGVHYCKTASYAVSTAQLLAGLPEGKYGGSVWVKNSGGQRSATLVINIDGKKYNKDLPVTDQWVKVELNDIPVSGGTLEISVWSESPAGCWIKYDDMSVYNMSNPERNLLPNGGFETLGTPPEETSSNTGAEGAGGDNKTEIPDDSEEPGGMEFNDPEDDPTLDIQAPEEAEKSGVDVLLVVGICVIAVCFVLSVVTFVLVLRRKSTRHTKE